MTISLAEVHQEVSRLLEKTDKLLLQYFSGEKQVISEVKTRHLEDLVTQADKQVEAIFKEALKEKFPQIGFIGEESDPTDIKDYNWVVDPIDGTMNFTYKIPIFGTSIALWKHNQPVYGIISLPVLNQTIHAIKNQGIYLNGQKYHSTRFLSDSFVVFSSGGHSEQRLKVLNQLLGIVSLPRSYACSVYQGLLSILRRAKAGIFLKNAIWDIGAIVILAQEAGLELKFISPWPDLKAKGLKDYQHSLVIGEADLVKKIVKAIKIK
jgi:myo-inositol-1(or 4)-monophosphatase